MPDLQDIYRLQAFVAAVDEGSLSAAVKRLHITQPALSARLKLLEEGLGCQLLERTGRGVRPTPMGELVYRNAVEILGRMKHLSLVVKNHLELRDGWIHLGGGATAVMGVFPDAIAAFRESYPNVQFTLHEQDSKGVIDAVRNGVIDLGVVTRSPDAQQGDDDELAGLRVHGEISDALEVIASPRHPLVNMGRMLEQSGKSLLPMHLNKQHMILFDEGSAIRGIIDAEFRRHYVHPRIVMTLRSTQSMLRMVEKNIGLSVVSRLSMRSAENVQTLKVTDLAMQRRLVFISAAERTLPPAADAFLQILRKNSEVSPAP
ncbi:MAG: LysR family transcriptional regulator [Proteobacteria bacterium]|nr:LysR family transcriptional regulator [Pseudomonadota bacterium]